MVIQHNIPALNAHRNLGINNANTAKNLEKLSSGYRINRAADDAAGLAISEKMRGQIRGLGMAEQNVSHGINLIQTAEGALNETHSILQRMRELAVQASNGTYQDEDRELITKEFEALKSEIDRIAESTHYNNIKLLDGSLGASGAATRFSNVNQETITKILAAIGRGNDLSAEQQFTVDDGTAGTFTTSAIEDSIMADDPAGVGTGAAAYVVRDVKVDYVDENGNKQSVTVRIDNVDESTGAAIDWSAGNETDVVDALVDALNKTDLAKYFTITNDGDQLKFEALKTGVEGAAQVSKITVTKSLDDLQVPVGSADDVRAALYNSADYLIANDMSASEMAAMDTVKGTAATLTINTATGSDPIGGVGTSGFVLGDPNRNWFEVAGQKFIFTNEFETGSTDGKGGIYLKVADPSDIKAGEGAQISKAMEEALGLKVTVTAANPGDPDPAGDGSLPAIPATASSIVIYAESAKTSGSKATGGALVFQIGANGGEDQRVSLNVEDMSAKGIGIDKTSIDTRELANKAIDSLESAIVTVAGQRASLGALQNRLEHTMNSLGVAKENLTAAESTIRDVDMAKEMMEFTKNNILVQAAQAMLAQANAIPQGALQLLG